MDVSVVTVIGAGLAGCEAALQCARRGVPVRLLEMRPERMTEAHETGDVAELVCSNSLKSDEPTNAHGLLKAELRVLGSILLECAERARVPGGKALVVDRRRFSAEVKRALDDAGIEVVRQEVTEPDFATKTPRHEASADGVDEGRGESSTDSTDDTDEREPNEHDTDVTVIATGPLTSPSMADALQALLGTDRLFFYDAIAPIVSAESLDMSRVFEGSRYGAGDVEKLDVRCEMSDVRSEEARTRTVSGYLNCPMTEEEYGRFVDALVTAELHPLHEFEDPKQEHPQITQITQIAGQQPPAPQQGPGTRNEEPRTFYEGCLPVEEIARRGRLALAFGPMKPVGLVDPRSLGQNGDSPWESHRALRRDSPHFDGHVPRRPFAVVQLRRENAEGTMYNLVGFQTRLRQGEQERVFRMIPGLEKVTFLRFGSIHRNTFLDSPKVLLPTLQTRASPDLLVAGQLTGVEGYVESIGAGLVAGVNAARLASGSGPVEVPREMMLGSLLRYISGGALECGSTAPALPESFGKAAASLPHSKRFQPMNANFGLLPGIGRLGTRSQFPGGIGSCPAPRLRGREKRRALAERALEAAHAFALTLVEKRA